MPSRRAMLAGLAAGLALGRGALAQGLPTVAVTKDPNCGCCEKWVTHLREAGFTVTVTEGPVNPVKARLGVPRDLASCHTAQVGGYAIEGHVPAGAIKRLLAEQPKATGLAVPGMPAGSPGMEVEGMEPDTYEVVLFGPAGREPFASYRGANPA
ncbi:metal-binding protein [Methylobacterium oryzae]|uniref:Metal-binding protein n=2 Tax=Methylobacterium oryzae TaxID=334852 RepID=A0ABU7TM06_9HYPH